MTLGAEDRYLAVDGVEAWKAGELEPLERALGEPLEGTILLLIARGKPPARLAEGGRGGRRGAARVRAAEAVGAAALGHGACAGVRAHARQGGGEGARRDRRPPPAAASERDRETLAGRPSARRAVRRGGPSACRRRARANRPTSLRMRSSPVTCARRSRSPSALPAADERPSKLIFPIVRRLRDVQRVSELLDAGMPEKQAQSGPQDAAVDMEADRRPGQEGRPRGARSAHRAPSRSSRSSCAEGAPASTRRPRSRSRWAEAELRPLLRTVSPRAERARARSGSCGLD